MPGALLLELLALVVGQLVRQAAAQVGLGASAPVALVLGAVDPAFLNQDVGLPLVIHCREAFEDVIRLLVEYGYEDKPVVVHCFSVTKGEADSVAQHPQDSPRSQESSIV